GVKITCAVKEDVKGEPVLVVNKFFGKPWVIGGQRRGLQYAENYCWAQDTYYVPMREAVAGMPDDDRRKRQIRIKIHEVVKLSSDPNNIKPEIKRANIRSLTIHLQGALRFHRRLQKKQIRPHSVLWLFNMPYSAFFVTWVYLCTKFFYLANVRVMGNVQEHTVQCVLIINIFNEKIFIFLWFWYMMLALFTSGSFLYWLFVAVIPYPNRRFVKRHLEISEMPFDPAESDEDVRRFIDNYLKSDGVFVLRMLTLQSGAHFLSPSREKSRSPDLCDNSEWDSMEAYTEKEGARE
ncbi:Innexin, partial [Teladorsagia circumcincta]